MYRRLLLSAYQARNRAYHANVLARKRDIEDATVFRHVLGGLHRGFGTSLTSYCENKDGVLPPKTKVETEAKNKVDAKNNVYLEEKEIVQQHLEVLQEVEIKEVDSSIPRAKEIALEEVKMIEEIGDVKTIVEQLVDVAELKTEDLTESHTQQEKAVNVMSQEVLIEETKMAPEHLEDVVKIKEVTKMAEQLVHVAALNTGDLTESDTQQEEALNNMSQEVLMEEAKMAPEQLEDVVKITEVVSSSQTEPKSVVENIHRVAEAKSEVNLVEGQAVGIKEGEPKRKGTVRSGKESLLDLLGAMKVEVTSKRKLIPLKVQLSPEPAAKPKPAAMESTISMFQQATAEAPVQSETLRPELVAATSAAASTLPNKSQAESELLQQLRQHESISEIQKKGELKNIGDVIADMKVGKRGNGRQHMRPADQIRFDDDGRGYTHIRGITAELGAERRKKSLFLGKRLGIFSPPTEPDMANTVAAGPTLWDLDFAEKLAMSVNQLPRNGFEEMVQWTKQGKLWQYPIDNEAGLEEEADVPFHEHVFLERHLEGVFPSQGPVRHFMELVVAGLAKNHCLTVTQKKEHIAWFGDYFQQKEEVLREADVYLN